jgi:integrase
VDSTTPAGKRNYAMLLLTLRTGLRAVDIINLKLGDIQWKRNAIEIVQSKTGTPLVLPLLTDIGNAIADYILNGRLESKQPYLFLRTQAPYRKLSARASGLSRTRDKTVKAEVAGFVQCLTRSCSQRRILPITLLLEYYEGKTA